MLALCQSKWQRANAWNFSFVTLYDGQFTLSTQLTKIRLPCYTLPLKQHHSVFRKFLSIFLLFTGQLIITRMCPGWEELNTFQLSTTEVAPVMKWWRQSESCSCGMCDICLYFVNLYIKFFFLFPGLDSMWKRNSKAQIFTRWLIIH